MIVTNVVLCCGLRNGASLMRIVRGALFTPGRFRFRFQYRRTHIRETSFRLWDIGTKELADWQSCDKTPTIYDRRDSAAAIYEIECPPTGRRRAVRLSIDLISHKGGSNDLLRHLFVPTPTLSVSSFQSYISI